MLEKERFSLFGFKIGKKQEVKGVEDQKSFAPPSVDDGALTVTSSAFLGTAIDQDGTIKNEVELISRYREMSVQPEIESAIEDIINEAIIQDDDGNNVKIIMDELKQSDKIKEVISEEFNNVLRLLNFNNLGSDIFRRYYIDGRLFYHVIIDTENPHRGILELRYIDPRKIKKIREIKKTKDETTGVEVITGSSEYYVYNDKVSVTTQNSSVSGVKIAPDSIVNVTSGLMDTRRAMVLSYLHKSIKPLNQLRMIEDACVINKLARAPQRRVFYIDVGSLPKAKADQTIRDVMTKYKNKINYNPATGEMQDSRAFMSMLEDYWLPRRCIALDTKIKLLDGRDVELAELIKEHEDGKENWAYSVSPEGEMVPGKISWAGITQRNASVVKVTIDSGEEIICTPDHKFVLKDGSLCEAMHLNTETALMPFNNSNNKVVTVEHLDYKIDTGTLTIDENHEMHDYHNFALSCGIYVKNSDGKSTEIKTLESADTFTDMSMVEYFERKLYKSLNVPITRLDPQQAYNIGRSAEITRDELKFSKFISKLRNKFSEVFDKLLRIQLVLKGVCTDDEWNEFVEDIYFDFIKDNNYAELKEAELLSGRIGILTNIDPFVGKYYSKEWVRKNVLQLDDAVIKDIDKQIQKERVTDFEDAKEDQAKQMELAQAQQEMQAQLAPQDQGQEQEQPQDQQDQGQAEQQPQKNTGKPQPVNPLNPYK